MNNIKKHIFIYLIFSSSLLFCPLQCIGGSITISWTGNNEPDLKGYYLYYGTSSGNYGAPHPLAANLTAYEITGLNGGTRYYIALSAYDFSDNESAKCQEISGIARSDPTSSITSTTSTTAIISITPGIPTTVEAEEMSYHANGSQVQTYWLLWSNGIMSEHVYFPSSTTYRLEITAKGTLAQNVGPEMELLIDDQVTGSVFVNTITPDTFVFDAVISEGVHTVAIGFYNDYYDPATGMDRNLYVDKTIIMSGAATNTIPGTPITTVPPTTSSIPANTNIARPTGTVSINDGQNLTSSPNVILLLSAITSNGEPLGRNGEMSFSNDNQVWSDPEPFTEEKTWILTAGEGNKTVYALFGDAAGNWMTEPAQDEIMYEETQNACTQGVQLSATSISASSEFLPFFAKENAIDGDPSTSWSTIFRLFQKEEFYTIDLGEVKNITSLSMYSSRMFGTDLFPTNFQIQVSNDNVTWLDMETIQGYSRPLDDGSPDNWQYNGLACRFLKVSISKCQTFLFFLRVAQIAEIEVYGCDKDDQVPPITGENRYIQKKDYPQKNAESERTPAEQQIPGIPGKPVIKFIN